MSLRIYNTPTREKMPFVPLVPGQVRMYVCGVTPYDRAHVGHGRSAVVFDVIRRYLSFRGYRVRFVKNYTDIDDKIIARSAQTGEEWATLAARHIASYEEDMAWLNVAPPDVAPRATQHITPDPGDPYRMVTLIERLVRAGTAYVVAGDVYFEVRRFPAYGQLSGRALDELRAGARVEVDERKRDPLDFALWKGSKPGEPAWPSPWGPGRPGWHIECSAMSMHLLGETLDIHGGGQDLIFPHHENEIAQSEGATGQPFVRYWLHNGFVNIGAEKMSKSLGNMLNVEQLRRGTATHPEGFAREAVRLYLLGTHYRSPLEFWEPRIDEAARALGRLQGVVGRAFQAAGDRGLPGESTEWSGIHREGIEAWLGALAGDALAEAVTGAVGRFTAAMDDDFNTPEALGALFDLGRVVNGYGEAGLSNSGRERFRHAAAVLLALARTLGLLWRDVSPYEPSAADAALVQSLVAERDAARRRRDWQRADEIRAELERRQVVVEDTPDGPRLRWQRQSPSR